MIIHSGEKPNIRLRPHGIPFDKTILKLYKVHSGSNLHHTGTGPREVPVAAVPDARKSHMREYTVEKSCSRVGSRRDSSQTSAAVTPTTCTFSQKHKLHKFQKSSKKHQTNILPMIRTRAKTEGNESQIAATIHTLPK